ncbi:MAG: hypothetical protein VB018_00850 [Lachnospiraceae bacterium]|nr:hypothetical protein [Lachnospiraceae bacterium]
MKKKRWIIFAVFMVMLLGTAARVYATAKQITAKDLKNLNDSSTMAKVSEILVKDMEKSKDVNAKEIRSITATYGEIDGKDNDNVVIVGNYGSNCALVGVYQKANGVYVFLDDIGVFFDVEGVNTVNLKNLGRDAVFIKEYAQQIGGAFERTTFLRGYLWAEDGFKLIYSMAEQVNADWNKYSDNGEDGVESQWNRVIQTSKTKLENGNYPAIKAQRNQFYLKSSDTEAKNIPADSTFHEVAKKEVSESYYWSDKWEKFIICEKVDKTTGEKVAVIEDWGNLPYSIVQDYEIYSSKVRIVRKDGTTDIVQGETLSEVRDRKNTIEGV